MDCRNKSWLNKGGCGPIATVGDVVLQERPSDWGKRGSRANRGPGHGDPFHQLNKAGISSTLPGSATVSGTPEGLFGYHQSKSNRRPNTLPQAIEDKIAAAKASLAQEAAAAEIAGDAVATQRVRIKFGQLEQSIQNAKKRQKYKRWAYIGAGIAAVVKFVIL